MKIPKRKPERLKLLKQYQNRGLFRVVAEAMDYSQSHVSRVYHGLYVNPAITAAIEGELERREREASNGA